MKKYLLYIVLGVICYFIGVYSGPMIHKKTEISSHHETVQRDTETKENQVINETVVERPDGTVETKRRITVDTTKKTKKQSRSDSMTVKKEIKERRPNNQITVLYAPKMLDNSMPKYGVMYQRRIIGSLYAGGYVMNDIKPEFGISVTLGF